MEEWDVDRYESSQSCAKNGKERKSKSNVGSWSIFMTGLIAILAFGGIIFIFRTDSRESSFDELVTTGGAVRRSVDMTVKVDDNKLKECDTKACRKLKKYIENSMNKTVDPCSNFYQYACGGWIKRNPIPTTSSTFSTFSKLNQKVEVILHKILNSSTEEKGTIRKVKQFYNSCMNQKKINKRGKKPMMDLIEYLHGWSLGGGDSWDKESWEMEDILLKIHTEFTSSGGPLFSVHVSDDPKHSNKHILEV